MADDICVSCSPPLCDASLWEDRDEPVSVATFSLLQSDAHLQVCFAEKLAPDVEPVSATSGTIVTQDTGLQNAPSTSPAEGHVLL